MTNEDQLMDDEQTGDAVAKYFADNPELLQGIVPVHDLWPEIESRISARVIPMSARPARVARKSLGWIPMLIAASALVVASAGVTYVLTRRATHDDVPGSIASKHTSPQPPDAAAKGAAQVIQPQPGETAVARNDVAARSSDDLPRLAHERHPAAQLASRREAYGSDDMRSTYDSEITTLHAALEARRGQLNPSTVAIIEQNLSVIDEAIRQSKAALAQDPNSRLLNDQLDRTLATKTGLLRAAALLPSA